MWNYTRENIELTAKWNKTNIYANLSVDEAYGAVDSDRVTIAIGDYYTLPIPSSLKEGESFQGWYNGSTKVTDAQGNSLDKCRWSASVNLTAAYYIEISTIYEFMDLQGKDLVGKYIITKDLDFKGLGVNYIKSLRGTFDGGGHTLKNFTLSTGAEILSYSGLFRTMYENSVICNMTFENVQCNEQYASGLVGIMRPETEINNICISDSFNSAMRSVLIGCICRDPFRVDNLEEQLSANLNDIVIVNSGTKAKSLCAYNIQGVKKQKSGFGEEKYTNDYYPSLLINGYRVLGSANQVSDAAGILYVLPYSYTPEATIVVYGQISINKYYLEMDIANGIISRREYRMEKSDGYYNNITVSKSEIHSKTNNAWSYVDCVTDSINTGKTQAWGASQSVRCIDAGSEVGTYDLGDISSSIVLYPNANGVYTYYSSSGTQATFDDASLINKNLFKSMLGFDETIWNLDNIDIANGLYPTIRK